MTTTGADLGAVAEAAYGLGKQAYVGLLDGSGKVINSRRITAVDVATGVITVDGGWSQNPAAGASFTVFYHGEMLESRAIHPRRCRSSAATTTWKWCSSQPPWRSARW